MSESYLATKWQIDKLKELIKEENFKEAKRIVYGIRNPTKREKVNAVVVDKLAEAINCKDIVGAEKCITVISAESSNKEVRQQLYDWISNASDEEAKDLWKQFYKDIKNQDQELEESIKNMRFRGKGISK